MTHRRSTDDRTSRAALGLWAGVKVLFEMDIPARLPIAR